MTRNTMLTEDYLIRLINQALAILASIVGLKTAGQYLQAQESIDQLLEEIFGLRPDLIKRLDDRNLLDALTIQDMLDTDRLSLAADLFKEQGDILASQNKSTESYWSYLRALNFHLEVALAGGARHYSPPEEKIEALVLSLQGFDLPIETLFALFSYYEQSGEYSLGAEMLDRMAEAPGMSQAIQEEQVAYYERLLAEPVEALSRGGFTRAEVEERLEKILAK